jgi:hypothetical protein
MKRFIEGVSRTQSTLFPETRRASPNCNASSDTPCPSHAAIRCSSAFIRGFGTHYWRAPWLSRIAHIEQQLFSSTHVRYHHLAQSIRPDNIAVGRVPGINIVREVFLSAVVNDSPVSRIVRDSQFDCSIVSSLVNIRPTCSWTATIPCATISARGSLNVI